MHGLVLSSILQLVNLSIFSCNVLDVKYKKVYVISVSFILSVIISSILSFISISLFSTLIITLVHILFVFFLFKGSLINKLFVIIPFIIPFFLAVSISELVSANFMSFLFTLQQQLVNVATYIIAIIISNIFTFIQVIIYIKVMKIDSKINVPKYAWFVFILPISTLLLLLNSTDYFGLFKGNFMIGIIIVGLFISNFTTIVIFFKVINAINLENKIKSVEMQFALVNSQYNTNFNFLHDTIRRLMKFNNLLSKKEYLELESNISSLNIDLLQKLNIISSNSLLLSSMINYRLSEINKYCINIKTVIEFNDYTFLNIDEQNVLFTQLLDMAIDSTIKAKNPNKNIIIKSKKIDNQIILQVIFTTTIYDEKTAAFRNMVN